MSTDDLSTAEAVRRLSTPIDALASERNGLDRRRFLQAVGMGLVGGSAALGGMSGLVDLPGMDRIVRTGNAWGAAPIGPTDGVLVTIFMYGGNDGLNTVVPYPDANYAGYHGSLALSGGQVLQLDGQVGLHPRLGYLRDRYAAGQLAIVQGIGAPGHDLSHFTSQARWFGGQAGSGAPTSGWIGRWLDGLPDGDPLRVVTIGNTVPLSVVGQYRRASAVPESQDGFGSDRSTPDLLMYQAVRGYSSTSAGRGAWHDAIAATEASQLAVLESVNPLLEAALPDGTVERRLTLAARLINADLGVRVIDVGYGDFDSHRDQLAMHDSRMHELDTGLRAFFDLLAAKFRSRVTVLILSEFGRTPWSNDSGGTDHGEAGVAFLVGDAVRGGRHGAYPSLVGKGRWDQLAPSVDFREVYQQVVQRWLGGDPTEVIGGAFSGLDLFAAAPGADQAPGSGNPPAAVVPVPAPADISGDFVPLNPARVLDTRNGIARSGALGPEESFDLTIMGVAGVPMTGVTAIAMNVTATGATSDGYLTIWPAGESAPATSSVNWRAGKTVPNLVVMRAGTAGQVTVRNAFGNVHVLGDIVGYFRDTDNDRFIPLAPARVLDTRNGVGAPAAAIGAGGQIDLVVAGAPGSGVPANGVDAVALNVTVDGPTAESYLTVWPTGEGRPEASSVNFERKQTVANLVIAKVGAGGGVSIFNAFGSTNVIADVVGCFSSTGLGRHRTVSPARILDTRDGRGPIGTDRMRFDVAGSGGVPWDATGVVMNVTITEPTADSYLTVWPAGEGQPTASVLNYTPRLTVANLVIARLGQGGALDAINAFGRTHVIVDVLGYFL